MSSAWSLRLPLAVVLGAAGASLPSAVLAAPDSSQAQPAPQPQTEAEPTPAPQEKQEEPEKRRRLFAPRNKADRPHPLDPPPDGRKWLVGLEGVVISSPPIRPQAVYLDPRFVGRTVALGGLGIFGRVRPVSMLGIDLGVRSGSVRYGANNSSASVSQDHILIDTAALLYLARGAVAQFAVSGGVGGMWSRVGYETNAGRSGVHTWGSALFRAGGEAEFLIKRIAFVLSFRMYASITDRDAVNRQGELLEDDTSANRLAPVATFQTMIVGSAGVAFRF